MIGISSTTQESYKAIFGNMPKRQHNYTNGKVIQQKLPTTND